MPPPIPPPLSDDWWPSPLRRAAQDVGPRRRDPGRVAQSAQPLGRLPQLAGPRDAPVAPALPPGAGSRLGAGQPVLRTGGMAPTDEVLGLGVSWRGDDALDVAGAAEHELALAPQHLRGGVG